MILSVASNIHYYEVIVEESPNFIEILASYPQAVYIIDENVWRIYAKTLLKSLPLESVIILPINENRKNLDTVQELYDKLVTLPTKRNLTIISFGGGILQDITGFTASTIYRGINWIFVPTTLLSQADSCIGSKTSLNYHKFKNIIGTFFPPTRIHIYIPFLQTQLASDFFSGFGEVVKLHLMGGQECYWEITKQINAILNRQTKPLLQIIWKSLQVKLSYMAGDEFDTGRRNLLNYGHDFGHALESTSNFVIPHGQAVTFGMIAANIVSQHRGTLDEKMEKEIYESLLLPSLVSRPTKAAIRSDAIIEAMKKDKKRTGDKLALIMMDRHFKFTRVNDLTFEEVTAALLVLEKRLI